MISFNVIATILAWYTEFTFVCANSYLVAAAGVQSLWSFSLAMIDAYALLVGRSLQNYRVVSLFAMGDGVSYKYWMHIKFENLCWHHLLLCIFTKCFVRSFLNIDSFLIAKGHYWFLFLSCAFLKL